MNLSLWSELHKRILSYNNDIKTLNWGRDIILDVANTLVLSERSVILDVGAGGGYDLSIFQEIHLGPEYHAIDYRDDNSAYLEGKGIVFHKANIEIDTIPLDSKSVDIVICNQVLEHCKEIFWIFHEISRVLRIGGCVLIGVPNLAALHNRILLFLGFQPTCIQVGSAHVRGFTRAGLESFILDYSHNLYVPVLFAGSNFYPFPTRVARFLSKLFPNQSVTIFFVFRKIREYDGQFLTGIHALESNFRAGPLIAP